MIPEIPNRFDPSDFPQFSSGMGRVLIHVSETDSTNRLAKSFVQAAWEATPQRVAPAQAAWEVAPQRVAPALDQSASGLDGTVFLADSQTAGRGRLNRTWNASAGQNLLLTALVHIPETTPDNGLARGLLPLATALAVAETLGAYVPTSSVAIKWPNDVLLNGLKSSGILVEAGPGNVFLVGIGLNVNESDFPDSLSETATSLLLQTGQRIDRMEIYSRLMSALTKYVTLLKSEPSALLGAYRAQVSGMNRPVRLNTGSAIVEGTMAGIHSDGGLIVESNAVQKVYYAGDVTLSPSSMV